MGGQASVMADDRNCWTTSARLQSQWDLKSKSSAASVLLTVRLGHVIASTPEIREAHNSFFAVFALQHRPFRRS